MDTYITRLCWNKNHWEKPSGSAVENNTFFAAHRFGFEEWLFSDFQIDGWRYGFVQGVNGSYTKKNGKDLRLILFTIKGPGSRYFVAEIKQCHVLTPEEAQGANRKFQRSRRLDQMIQDIRDVKGDADCFEKAINNQVPENRSGSIVNIRYRPEHLIRKCKTVPLDSKVWKYPRYKLYAACKEVIDEWEGS